MLPWAKTGRRTRTGVDLVRVSRSLHLATRAPAKVLLVAVCATPFLLAAGWIAWAANRAGPARLLTALTGTVAIAAALALMTSSLHTAFGAVAGGTLGGATLLLAVGHWRHS